MRTSPLCIYLCDTSSSAMGCCCCCCCCTAGKASWCPREAWDWSWAGVRVQVAAWGTDAIALCPDAVEELRELHPSAILTGQTLHLHVVTEEGQLPPMLPVFRARLLQSTRERE